MSSSAESIADEAEGLLVGARGGISLGAVGVGHGGGGPNSSFVGLGEASGSSNGRHSIGNRGGKWATRRVAVEHPGYHSSWLSVTCIGRGSGLVERRVDGVLHYVLGGGLPHHPSTDVVEGL